MYIIVDALIKIGNFFASKDEIKKDEIISFINSLELPLVAETRKCVKNEIEKYLLNYNKKKVKSPNNRRHDIVYIRKANSKNIQSQESKSNKKLDKLIEELKNWTFLQLAAHLRIEPRKFIELSLEHGIKNATTTSKIGKADVVILAPFIYERETKLKRLAEIKAKPTKELHKKKPIRKTKKKVIGKSKGKKILAYDVVLGKGESIRIIYNGMRK